MAKNLQNEQLEEMGKRRRQGRIMKRVFIGAAVCVAFSPSMRWCFPPLP